MTYKYSGFLVHISVTFLVASLKPYFSKISKMQSFHQLMFLVFEGVNKSFHSQLSLLPKYKGSSSLEMCNLGKNES